VARAHQIAAIVENPTHQQGLGFGTGSCVIILLLCQLGLDRIEEIAIDDGGLLARQNLTLICYLADVESITEQIGEGAAREGDPADHPAGLHGLNL
jgi:hypothetical protein